MDGNGGKQRFNKGEKTFEFIYKFTVYIIYIYIYIYI